MLSEIAIQCPETRFVNGLFCHSNPLEIFGALPPVSVVVVDWMKVRCVYALHAIGGGHYSRRRVSSTCINFFSRRKLRMVDVSEVRPLFLVRRSRALINSERRAKHVLR